MISSESAAMDALRADIAKAVEETIRHFGVDGLKKTSLFMSNERAVQFKQAA